MSISNGAHETHEATERKHLQSHESTVAGTPIVAKADNEIQQRHEMQAMLKAFRLTSDSNNAFTIVDSNSGAVVSDKRPFTASAPSKLESAPDQRSSDNQNDRGFRMFWDPQEKQTPLTARELEKVKAVEDALLQYDATGPLKSALAGLSPGEVKHIVEQVERDHKLGLRMQGDKTGLHVHYGAGLGATEVYSSPAQQQNDASQHKSVAPESSTSRDLVLTTTMWTSLESKHHHVGEQVYTTDKQGHKHTAEIGKVTADGHITQIIDTDNNHHTQMSLDAYKAKHRVGDVAQFSWPTPPHEKNEK